MKNVKNKLLTVVTLLSFVASFPTLVAKNSNSTDRFKFGKLDTAFVTFAIANIYNSFIRYQTTPESVLNNLGGAVLAIGANHTIVPGYTYVKSCWDAREIFKQIDNCNEKWFTDQTGEFQKNSENYVYVQSLAGNHYPLFYVALKIAEESNQANIDSLKTIFYTIKAKTDMDKIMLSDLWQTRVNKQLLQNQSGTFATALYYLKDRVANNNNAKNALHELANSTEKHCKDRQQSLFGYAKHILFGHWFRA